MSPLLESLHQSNTSVVMGLKTVEGIDNEGYTHELGQLQQRIELTVLFEGMDIVTPSNMNIIDEDLRERSPSICPFSHLGPS